MANNGGLLLVLVLPTEFEVELELLSVVLPTELEVELELSVVLPTELEVEFKVFSVCSVPFVCITILCF